MTKVWTCAVFVMVVLAGHGRAAHFFNRVSAEIGWVPEGT